MPPPRRLGSDAEDLAANFLLALGWTLLGRRVKLQRGEVDLVALDGEVLVFIEVKMRTRAAALESITPQKQRRWRAAAEEYLAKFGLPADHQVRFDAITLSPEGIGHYPNVLE